MARRHEAYARADAHIRGRLREAIESSRNSRSPAHRLYPRGPSGGPERPPRMRQAEKVLSAHQVKEIERIAGEQKTAVRSALADAGLLPGARPQRPESGQDRGAVSPLGGTAT